MKSGTKIFLPAILSVGLLVLLLLLFVSPAAGDENPAADGFNAAGSDARAIALADRAMSMMGGREAWDNTRYITWRFFGARTHVWGQVDGYGAIRTG